MSDQPHSPPADLTLDQALALAQSHWNAGQAQQAEHWCRQILATLPGQPDALNLLGVIAHAYRQPDLAIELFRQACLPEEASANHLSNLAEMCRQKGLLDEARQAGALGCPSWVMLAFVPCWRWLLGRSDSPWYPSVRLFRQPGPDQWAPMLAEMAEPLRRLAAKYR